MFSPEKTVCESSIEKLKFISGAQVFLGVGLVVCAVIGEIQEDHFNNYFMCGFTSGVPGAVAGIGGILTVYKASSYNYDLRKKSLCTERLQLVFGFAIIMNSFFGISFNISFLKNDNDDDVNDVYMTHVILSACILSGIILLLLVTFLTYITICYQPKGYNQRINHSYYPNTVGGTQYHQGQSPYAQQHVYSTGGYYPGSNPPPYTPPPPYFGIGKNSTQYGVQPTSVPTAPPQPYSYYP